MDTGKVTLSHSLHRQITRLQVRYAALMSIVALAVGLLDREFSRPFFRGLTLEQRMTYGHFLELLHGHTFLLGTAIPVAMALLLFLMRGDLDVKSMLRLSLRFKVYIWASVAALILMLYKGIAFVVGAGQPLDAIDASLFFGSRILRGVLFGGAHIALSWALAAYMVELLRAGKRRQ